MSGRAQALLLKRGLANHVLVRRPRRKALPHQCLSSSLLVSRWKPRDCELLSLRWASTGSLSRLNRSGNCFRVILGSTSSLTRTFYKDLSNSYGIVKLICLFPLYLCSFVYIYIFLPHSPSLSLSPPPHRPVTRPHFMEQDHLLCVSETCADIFSLHLCCTPGDSRHAQLLCAPLRPASLRR